MASITMATSFVGSAAVANRSLAASRRQLVVSNAARTEGENVKVSYDTGKDGSNGRRNLMFAAAAAAVCSAAGIAVADIGNHVILRRRKTKPRVE